MSAHEKRETLNRLCAEYPQEGDFWHEMFCPYFIVVAVDEKGILVLHKTIPVGATHYRFDENHVKYMTREELMNAVTYKTMRDKFVATCYREATRE
jgi:hypothetical protein